MARATDPRPGDAIISEGGVTLPLTRREAQRVFDLVLGRVDSEFYPPEWGSPEARLDDGIAAKLRPFVIGSQVDEKGETHDH